MTNEERRDKLKEFIQKHSPGGCRMLSAAMGKIEKCSCLLCCADDLYGELKVAKDELSEIKKVTGYFAP